MPPPVFVPGQVLNADDVNQWLQPLVAYKSSDLGRNTTSQTADPDLVIPVQANGIYRVTATLFYKISSTAGTDFTWTWTIPAGTAAGIYYTQYLGGGGGFVTEANLWTDAPHNADAGVVGTIYGISIEGTLAVGGTAGNFVLNWAANSATPVTTLTARSIISLQRSG